MQSYIPNAHLCRYDETEETVPTTQYTLDLYPLLIVLISVPYSSYLLCPLLSVSPTHRTYSSPSHQLTRTLEIGKEINAKARRSPSIAKPMEIFCMVFDAVHLPDWKKNRAIATPVLVHSLRALSVFAVHISRPPGYG